MKNLSQLELNDRIIACLECEIISRGIMIDFPQGTTEWMVAARITNDINRKRLDYERELEKFKTLDSAIDSNLKK